MNAYQMTTIVFSSCIFQKPCGSIDIYSYRITSLCRSVRLEDLQFCSVSTEIHVFVEVKVKVNFTLEQATKSHRASRGIALPLSLTSALNGVRGQRHAPAALPPGKTGMHFIGDWVGTTAAMDGCGKSRF
jgi:hypothetical protein